MPLSFLCGIIALFWLQSVFIFVILWWKLRNNSYCNQLVCLLVCSSEFHEPTTLLSSVLLQTALKWFSFLHPSDLSYVRHHWGELFDLQTHAWCFVFLCFKVTFVFTWVLSCIIMILLCQTPYCPWGSLRWQFDLFAPVLFSCTVGLDH